MSVLGPLGSVRFDTGLELELLTAGLSPLTSTRTRPPVAELDNRSDNKGPRARGRRHWRGGRAQLPLPGRRAPGGLFAYELDGASADFAAYANTRPADLGPEGVRFIPRRDSPTGRALLLVTREISGTVAAFQIEP